MTSTRRDPSKPLRLGHSAPDTVAERSPGTHRRSVLVEIVLFLGLALLADHLWGTGNRFIDVEPHPFWVIVLLMAVQYGTSEALLAAAASSVVLLAGNMPVQGFDQNVQDYTLHVLLRPLSWIVASVVLGELRGRHHLLYTDTASRLRDAERRVALLSQSHTDLLAAKERLETRLAGQLHTAAGVLEAARPLETLDPDKVLAGAADLLRAALNARAFSLYLLKGDVLTLAAAEGWSETQSPPRSYPASTALFQEVVGGQRHVSVATAEGERLLEGQGLMAGPLVDPSTGALFGMLKVDEMRFLDFNRGSVQTFKAVCQWVAAAYGNAVVHRSGQVQDEVTLLFGMKHLDRQTEYLTEVALRFGFDLTLLSFQVESADLPEAARRKIPAQLSEAAQQVLRRTDLVFGHQPPSNQFAVLLPGAPADGSMLVARKLVDALHAVCGYDVPCKTQVRAICVADHGPSRRGRRVSAAADQVA